MRATDIVKQLETLTGSGDDSGTRAYELTEAWSAAGAGIEAVDRRQHVDERPVELKLDVVADEHDGAQVAADDVLERVARLHTRDAGLRRRVSDPCSDRLRFEPSEGRPPPADVDEASRGRSGVSVAARAMFEILVGLILLRHGEESYEK